MKIHREKRCSPCNNWDILARNFVACSESRFLSWIWNPLSVLLSAAHTYPSGTYFGLYFPSALWKEVRGSETLCDLVQGLLPQLIPHGILLWSLATAPTARSSGLQRSLHCCLKLTYLTQFVWLVIHLQDWAKKRGLRLKMLWNESCVRSVLRNVVRLAW